MNSELNWKPALQNRDFPTALATLRLLAEQGTDPTKLVSAARALDRIPDTEFNDQKYEDLRIGFLSGYTVDFIVDLTRICLLPYGIRARVHKADYGLYEQVIMEKNAELVEFRPDFIHLGVGTEHIRHHEQVELEVRRWRRLWEIANSAFGCSVIQDTFVEPAERVFGNYEIKTPISTTHYVRKLNAMMSESAPSFVHFNDVDYLAAFHGRGRWRDWKLYDLSKSPVSYENLVPLSRSLASVFAAALGRSRKCLVLDLDNTLWGGVIGDLGPEGVAIGQGSPDGEAYLRLQRFILDLKKRGVILAVCSKNDDLIAREPFLTRQDMAIKLDDISCFVANWNPKPNNLKLIAQDLNIGLDALVLLDDNPVERHIVRQCLPEVGIVDLPEDPSEFTSVLASTRFFETVSLTREDLERTSLYRANRERQGALTSADSADSEANYGKVLESLDMELIVRPFDADNLPRITQLINKTNQFNLTTRRYTDAQATARMTDPEVVTLQARLLDRFGDNGLISVIIALPEKKALSIDSWLMSCRVLKRGVETALFQELVRMAQARGFRAIHGDYIPTAKNSMVKRLYSDLGFGLVKQQSDGRSSWQFDLTDSARVTEVLSQSFPLRVKT